MHNKHGYLINGNLSGHISPLDRGFSYGDGVFRTLKVAGGVPQFWAQHYQKLAADCSAIGIVCPPKELLQHELATLFADDSTGFAKIIISRGEGERGYAPPAIASPTRVILRGDLPHYAPANFKQGVALRLCKMRLAAQPSLAGIKHLNRLENVLARAEWADSSLFDGILCDAQGHMIECTSANIFVRLGVDLLTPDLSQCGVAGVTRDLILQAAPQLGLNAKVTQLTWQDLLAADEMIICNSLYGAFQVHTIEHQPILTHDLGANVRAALLGIAS